MIHLTHEALALVGILLIYLIGIVYIVRGYFGYDLGEPSLRALHSIITAQMVALYGSAHLCRTAIEEVANLYVLHSLFKPSGKPGLFVLRDGQSCGITLQYITGDKWFEYKLHVNGTVPAYAIPGCYGMFVSDTIKCIALARTPRECAHEYVPHAHVDVVPAVAEIARLTQAALKENPLVWIPTLPQKVGIRTLSPVIHDAIVRFKRGAAAC